MGWQSTKALPGDVIERISENIKAIALRIFVGFALYGILLLVVGFAFVKVDYRVTIFPFAAGVLFLLAGYFGAAPYRKMCRELMEEGFLYKEAVVNEGILQGEFASGAAYSVRNKVRPYMIVDGVRSKSLEYDSDVNDEVYLLKSKHFKFFMHIRKQPKLLYNK